MSKTKSFIEQFIDVLEDEKPIKKDKKSKISVKFVDTVGQDFVGGEIANLTKQMASDHRTAITESNPLVKSVLNIVSSGGTQSNIERLAFETNPEVNNTYQSLYRRKLRLLPNELLKRIAIQDDLVAAILNTRAQMVSSFGRPQPDRFSTGYKIEIEPGLAEEMSDAEKEAIQKQIKRAETLLMTCGQTAGIANHKGLGFSQYLFQQARNAVLFGYTATEIIYANFQGKRTFHSFRPIDAGTIYQAAPQYNAAESVRNTALTILSQIKNKKLRPETFVADEYAWVQVINGVPKQAFSPDECLVYNFYPVTDIELDGYPLTPLDTVISAVSTHINITTHNKLFFQNGRAAKGMLVFKSEDVDDRALDPIRQQFQSNINGVNSSWRMPIFCVGSDDEVEWQSIEGGSSRDMEFQYMSDSNARTILSAFQMSPDEIPGFAHLSRGTNSQSLSEGNNEFKLEAGRDVGIRPLLAGFQNHLNADILPLIDPDLAKKASIKLIGLDAETAEKESTRFQQDMSVHLTFDEVLDKVEKSGVGKQWGGRFPLNPQWQQALFQHRYVGEVMEEFFGVKGASQDPSLRYLRDPMWFQWQKMLQDQAQIEAQAQQAQTQPQPGQEQGQGQSQDGDLSRSADQLIQGLSKSEAQLPASKRRLLHHQRKTVEQVLSAFEAESKEAIKEIVEDTVKLLPRKNKK